MNNAPLPIPPLSIFGITPRMPRLSRTAFHSPGTKPLELEISDPCEFTFQGVQPFESSNLEELGLWLSTGERE